MVGSIFQQSSEYLVSFLWKQVAKAAKEAVAERGSFSIAIPGGSILKATSELHESVGIGMALHC